MRYAVFTAGIRQKQTHREKGHFWMEKERKEEPYE